MDTIGKYLVAELIKEIENITDYVVVYSGRFQPFHKGHFATYQHLVKKFGKGNVYIGTSDKTDKSKSPFNFKEKKTIMTKMFGIPSNKIVEIKNPYIPTEILKNFDKNATAYITVVGEKDEQRLGGKYFTPYKGVFDAGYADKGYVYISPAQPNAISGTDVRNWLGKGEVADRKELFSKAYPKFDEAIFQLITTKLSSLNESGSIDAGEPDVGYYVDGAKRIINGAKPEIWFKQGGYKQLDKPKSDNMRGKGKAKDKESQFRKVTFRLKGVTQSGDGNAGDPYQVDKWKKVTTRALKKKEHRYWDLDNIKEQIFIPKEIIEEWVDKNLTNFLKELTTSTTGPSTNFGKNVDDGPNFFYKDYATFDKISKERAENIGYTVFAQIMSGEYSDYTEYPIYPTGPVKAVTPFPAGVIGATTATNQKDFFGDEAYSKWYAHVTRAMGLAGYQIVKDVDNIAKELSIQSADNIKKVAGIEKIKDTVMENGMGLAMGYPSKEQLAQKKKERDVLRKKLDNEGEYYKSVDEDITIPVKIGDTVLMGKFKNKKVVVKSIGTDDRGLPTINGKKVVNFRLFKETYIIESVGDEVDCPNCTHSWKIESDDVNPYLCHKCGWDVENNKFDYKKLKQYKMKTVDELYNDSINELIKEFQKEGMLSEIPMGDLQQINKYADKQFNPVDVVITGRHFLDRLVDPRNKKPITAAELTGFFKRLSRKKDEFVEFLKKYGEVVAKDNRTKINIPFMKQANKAIAKTIMRKDDFKTPSPELKFERYINETEDHGKTPYVIDLEAVTKSNTNYRTTKWTGEKLQMTLMSIDDEIGLEVHKEGDQFIRVEGGYGKVLMGKDAGNLTFEKDIEDDYAIFIPAGYYHNIINTSDAPLKLYVIYSPVEHPKGKIDITKPIKEGMYDPKNIKAYYEALCKAEGIKSLPVKFDAVGKGGAATTYNSRTMKPLYISFNVNRLSDPEFAIIHELTHQIKLETEGDVYIGKRDQLAKFKKLENKLIDKYVYSNYSKLLYEVKFESVTKVNNKTSHTKRITEGGSYGHMAHPFDIDINLTFGQLKDIVKKALTGELELTFEKTDGQALAVSWVNGRLVAARNKSHLKDRGKGAMDISAVAAKFGGRGGLTDAYNFAMKDLSVAIDKLSNAQKEKIFNNGANFMNLEVIYPESVNVIPYGQALLVFHGTFKYDEAGNIIGEDQTAGRILAGMIKQINQNVQSKYTIQGPPVTKLPKNIELSKLQPKYLSMISKLQNEFGLKDNQGVAEYHQKWWEVFVNKNAPTLDAQEKIGLVKRWAFMDKGFRLKSISDEKIRKWADGIDKGDQTKISKDNLMKFEKIFLGVGADVLSFMSSVLTVNPDKAKRAMIARLEQTIKDVETKGSEAQLAKLKLELQRLQDVGGFEKIVPIEGIVFQGPNGQTMKLTGSFASSNQLLGIFFNG